MSEDGNNELNTRDMNLPGDPVTSLLHGSENLQMPFMKDIFLLRQRIVGTRFQGGSDQMLGELKVGSRVSLIREPDNPYDEKAVMALDEKGRKLGYLPRHENAVISALMDAGKFFYGILQCEPPKRPADEQTRPHSLWVDLYMREFRSPDDYTEIPRQASEGSYAVLYMELEKENDAFLIQKLHALKIISGEERGSWSYVIQEGDRQEEETILASGLEHFIGNLPIVAHGIEDAGEAALAELYGLRLGKNLPNLVIDTKEMAMNLLPGFQVYSLEVLGAILDGVYFGQTDMEERCHDVWNLYRKLDCYDLSEARIRLYRCMPIEVFSDNYIVREATAYTLNRVARRCGIQTLGDLLDRSDNDLEKLNVYKSIRPMGRDMLYDCLDELDLHLSEEDYEPPRVHFDLEIDQDSEWNRVILFLHEFLSEKDFQTFLLAKKEDQLPTAQYVTGKLFSKFADEKDMSLAVSCLKFSVYAGLTTDYSMIGLLELTGLAGVNQDREDGYFWLRRFYEDFHTGRLNADAPSSMLQVCYNLAACLGMDCFHEENEKVMDASNIDKIRTLLKEAVYYAPYSDGAQASLDMMVAVGGSFYNGFMSSADKYRIPIGRDFEQTYKICSVAADKGSEEAKEILEDIGQPMQNSCLPLGT